MYCNKNRIALSEIIPQSRELDILRKVTLNKKVWILIIVCHGNCMLKINDGKEIWFKQTTKPLVVMLTATSCGFLCEEPETIILPYRELTLSDYSHRNCPYKPRGEIWDSINPFAVTRVFAFIFSIPVFLFSLWKPFAAKYYRYFWKESCKLRYKKRVIGKECDI